MKQIIVAQDEGANECLYVNGERWPFVGEITVHACDIAEVVGNDVCTFELKHVALRDGEEWPKFSRDLREDAPDDAQHAGGGGKRT